MTPAKKNQVLSIDNSKAERSGDLGLLRPVCDTTRLQRYPFVTQLRPLFNQLQPEFDFNCLSGKIFNVEVVDGGLIYSIGVHAKEMGDNNDDYYIVNASTRL
ncbi:hypothetical protein EZV62_023418 [Acer yangbiense]|uniref:Uncharacterized protein n=1 Tax=Acer yangbiense TaxID=1000413 RepID=A0A5C7H1N1_9ROSI|nr:hypothetical protein EZV62_023418 [Acer yangbiense]